MSELVPSLLLTQGADFVWDESVLLSHWLWPAATSALYLAACVVHNLRLKKRSERAAEEDQHPTPILDRMSVVHNANLVVFSALTFCVASYEFGMLIAEIGLHDFLCPPVPPPWRHPPHGGLAARLPPLAGPLHYWCYVFYLSKYYELLDTALLLLRGKRVIFLHAVHHAFIPLVMVLLFDGRVSVSLVGLTVLNSLVHVVMYAYYLASALGCAPSLAWKRQVTRLQILQFSAGAVGGSCYWLMYLREPRLALRDADGVFAPRLSYTEGCTGGEPLTVLVGYLMNTLLLGLFLRFYWHAYVKAARRREKVG